MTSAIIATTPAQMQEAAGLTLSWVEKKIEGAKYELTLAQQTFNALQNAGLRTQPSQTQIKKANHRIGFYEKVRAALAAGYYIIPPFRVQAFAIRVPKGSRPRLERSDASWQREHKPRNLPPGEGFYVSPDAARFTVGTEKRDEGKREVQIYENSDDWSGVDLPLIAHKPELIEAVQGALEARIFDALGIAPDYRSSDPIIVGQIRHWRRYANPLTFFVAWWLDERDL